MKLVLDAVRLLGTRLLGILVIAAVIGGAALLWSWTVEQKGFQDRAAQLRIEVESSFRDWRTNRVRFLEVERWRLQLENDRPNPILHPSDYLAWRSKMQTAESAVEAAKAARDRAQAVYETGRIRLAEIESRLDDTLGRLKASVIRVWWIIAIASAGFLFGPLLWKAFWYYAVASWTQSSEPIRLIPDHATGEIQAIGHGKIVEALVRPGRPLIARMDWVQQYTPGMTKRTRFLLDWRSPLISYAAGLREMTELRMPSGDGTQSVMLTSAVDTHAYLVALELKDHPGLSLRPGAVVALAGDVKIRSLWRIWSVHSWIAGRLRHILFCGTGTLYVTGHGGIELCRTAGPVVVEESLVVGADARSGFSAVRTETFWPFFRGRTSLFDYRFEGDRCFLRQTSVPAGDRARGNPFMRAVEASLNGIGNLLGF
ncbi:MAG: AIM24 family protein [Verrucomicrobiales bacterium]|nr:AIM24 family protein [Verrucomicrobiales bacterium]